MNSWNRTSTSRFLALGFISTWSGACASRPPQTAEAPASSADRPITGFLSSRYRGRSGLGETDHDLYETLSLDWGSAEKTPASGHVLGELAWDLDGADGGEFAFFSLQDTYDHRLTGRLHHAYLDVHRWRELEVLRLGRQPLYETPVTLYFDGVRCESSALEMPGSRVGAYGGIPVHPYESSSDGDFVAGLFGQWDVWKQALLRLDWMHLTDENRLGDHQNDLLGVELQQAIRGKERDTLFQAKWTGLDGSGRDLRLSTNFFDSERGFSFDASYYELVTKQNDLAVPLDPFTSALFELFPYHQVTLLASKTWKRLVLQGGADVRRVDDPEDVGQFNRDFVRGHVTATTDALLPWDLALSLTGETWESDGNDFESWGIDLSREVGKHIDASVGSYYSPFKYDLFANEERDHVRTWYFDVRYDSTPSTRLSLDYELEQNDLDDFHLVKVGCTWRF